MKIEDCKVEMKVEPLKDFGDVHKDGLKIHSINKERSTISIRNGCFISSDHNPKFFEPVNKFEIGDEVIYALSKEKMRFCGLAKNNIALLQVDNDLIIKTELKYVYPLKKEDELEVGDKFKDEVGKKVKIISVNYDDYHDVIVYTTKRITGATKGLVSMYTPNRIREIIYD